MTEWLRFLSAGSGSLLVELGDLETTITLLDSLRDERPDGITELIPGARTLLVRFDKYVIDRLALIEFIACVDLTTKSRRNGETFDIPVTYDGEDLNDIAELLGWTVEELICRHTAATYTVAFTGFAPGFAYMTSNDPGFDVPRRKNPRVRIPAGSVALGGKFGGIYPTDTPGGWQLLGRTPLKMWDPNRSRAALLRPGDRVRFCDLAKGSSVLLSAKESVSNKGVPPPLKAEGILVTRADRPALFQDHGRRGQAAQGVSESGALDHQSLIEANLCVGNPSGSAVIEIAYGGFAIKADRPITLAVTGAPTPMTIHAADGNRIRAPNHKPFALDAGDELTLEYPPEGTRSYLAVRGGFAVTTVLGSAASDTLAKVGPSPIAVGDVLSLGSETVSAVDPYRPMAKNHPKAEDTISLDVILGPRTDWFTEKGLATLLRQEWQVTPESSRVGMRLAADEPLERADATELPSEGTPLGSIQVPHNGRPVLFLADHPLTGGYPVIGVVAAHHLDLAGQVPIGAKIRFNPIAPFDPLLRDTAR